MIPIRNCHIQLNNILKQGIKMEFESDKEIKQTAAKILFLINSTAGSHCAGFDKEGTTINIETTYCDPVLSLEFTKEGIHFIPLVDSTWQGAFFEVVRIIYMWECRQIKIEDEDKKKRKEEDHSFDWI